VTLSRLDGRPRGCTPGAPPIEDHPGEMAWRRVLLFCFLLVVIGAVASATVPREKDPAVRQTLPSQAPLAPPADVVNARLPAPRDVKAKVGDIVQLEVSHDAQDVVQVLSLGVSEPVERDLDAQLVFDADRPGRFAVTLRDAGTRIGTVEVTQAG
jgi:hypothetical protein